MNFIYWFCELNSEKEKILVKYISEKNRLSVNFYIFPSN